MATKKQNEPEILDWHEKNALIAKFMGEKEDHYPEKLPNHFSWFGKLESRDMHYHDDWSWLMPVVEKIATEYDVSITWLPTALNVTYIERPDVNEGEISSMGGGTALDNTYYAVIGFIKWSNKNPRKTKF